jgi:hypothetical protein
MQQAMRLAYPWLTKEHCVYDQGPHFKGTETLLTQRELGEATGLEIKSTCKEESGMGTGQVDKQCGLTKLKMGTNTDYDVIDGVDAHTKCLQGELNGGVSGNMSLVMKAHTMVRPPKPLKALKGFTNYHNTTYNADGSATFWRSYNIGPGLTVPAEDLDALMDGKTIEPSPVRWYQPEVGVRPTEAAEGRPIQKRDQCKGLFTDEQQKRNAVTARAETARSLAAQKVAAKKAEIEVMRESLRRSARCPGCLKLFSTDSRMETHMRLYCGNELPDQHLFPCCACGVPGHRTPESASCTPAAKAAWGEQTEEEQQQQLDAAKDKWKLEYTPRYNIEIEVDPEQVPILGRAKKELKAPRCGAGGLDNVSADIKQEGW